MASYPVRRGTMHLGMFSEEEVRNLLGLGRLLASDEVQLPQGWVGLGVAFPVGAPAAARPSAGTATAAPGAGQSGKLAMVRCLLGLTLCFTVATFVLDLALVGGLPEPLRAWRNQDEADSPQLAFMVLGAFFVIVPCIAWLVGVVAVWFRQKWGAHLMLGTTFVLAVINMIEPTVMHGVASTCSDLGMLCEGGALALMYFTDALEPAP